MRGLMLLSKRLLRRCAPLPLVVLVSSRRPPSPRRCRGRAWQPEPAPYHFVFIAYAIAWVFVLGWVISVGAAWRGWAVDWRTRSRLRAARTRR